MSISNLSAQDTRVWSTYYGGIGMDESHCVTTDNLGNIYLAGQTDSPNGISSGGFQDSIGGLTDAYLVKFDALGNRLWATYYGGINDEDDIRVTTDTLGNVYLAGWTYSDSAIASGGFQNIYGGLGDAFLVKFDAAGNRLWATYYGGSAIENGLGVSTDISGNVYLTGLSYSTSNIASGGFQNSMAGIFDAFLVKFDSSGNRIWATYYGGIDQEVGQSVVTDISGNVFISGWTKSASGIASGGFQNTFGGLLDAFLVKFDSTGNLLWSTYYGGTGQDFGWSISADLSGNICLAGWTQSISNIASGGFQNTYGGNTDGFLVKFNGSGVRQWATYYGGLDPEETEDVAIDPSGNIYLAGDTYSASGIASGGFQNNLLGTENEFVVKFDSNGSRLCATYYGQMHDEYGKVAVDDNGSVYLVGMTESISGIASGGFQNTFGGGLYDAYLVKFTSCGEVGINENENRLSFNIYPNPTKQIATLEFDNSNNEIFELTIFNSYGKLVWTTSNISTNRIELNTQNLTNGLYLFYLQSDKQIATGKLIIE